MAFPSPQWSWQTTYAINALVNYNGLDYISLQNGNVNQNPSTQVTWWSTNTDWSAATTYTAGQVATRNGIGYESVVGGNLNHDPATAANIGPWWERVVVKSTWTPPVFAMQTMSNVVIKVAPLYNPPMLSEPGAPPVQIILTGGLNYYYMYLGNPPFAPGVHNVSIGRIVFRVPRTMWFTGLGSRANQPEVSYNQE